MNTQPKTRRASTLAHTVATFFGIGYLKPGPGTYASAATVLLWFACMYISPLGGAVPRMLCTLLVAIVITAVGIPAATVVARESGRKDPSFVVIDEVAGQLVVLIFARPHWPDILLALVLFRLFDIWKPWPIRRLERLPGGTGIVVDDLAAGVYAAIAFLLFIDPLLLLMYHHR